MIISKLNKLLYILLLIAYVIVNIMMILHYCHEYIPDYFHNTKLYNTKYRCIQNFVEKKYNICQDYKYDYMLFIIKKYRCICLFIAYNITMISLFVIIYCI